MSPFLALAQPANDNCTNAIPITISAGGFGLGSFTSSYNDLTQATVQAGENFAPAIFVAGQNQKSIWYKFTLPTTRAVTVRLLQPGTAIAAGDAGFAIYKTNTCLPAVGQLSIKLTPIATFGYTFNPCVDAGDYLVQVSGNNAANGPLGIEVTITDSTGAVYDHPAQASSFGVLTNPLSKVDFAVDCQSLESAAEVCTALSNYQQYTKSTWHTFTTPAYFDYLSVILASSNTNCYFSNGTATFGYNLYAGNVVTAGIGGLTLVDGCDSFVTSGYYADKKIYRCSQLAPNTTYTIQLFYNENFSDNVRLAVDVEGKQPTQAPKPILSQIPASNQLGTVVPTVAGVKVTATDYLACNSRDIGNSCGPSMPTSPLRVAGYSTTYDLSTFFTFTLSSEANISIITSTVLPYYNLGAPPAYFRLYNQAPTNNCASLDTTNIILQGITYGSLTCLGPGTYTVEVMGTDSAVEADALSCNSLTEPANYYYPILGNLGQEVSFACTFTSINAFDHYSLIANNAYDTVNSMRPLLNQVVYAAKADTFGCNNTVMPVGAAQCNLNAHKAIYREFVVGDAGNGVPDSGIVTLSNALGSGTQHSMLFAGDANALADAQNVHAFPDSIKGLIPYSACLQNPGCYNANICVTPGTYTLVTMADANSIGQDPGTMGIKFSLVTTKHYSGPTAQDMGSILDTLGPNGGTKYSDVDIYSCQDNAVTINGYAPPLIYYNTDTASKVIYRQFYLKAAAQVQLTEYNNNSCNFGIANMTLFAGRATDGLNTLQHLLVNGVNVSTTLATTVCDPLPAGWYTVASYSFGPTYANPLHDGTNSGVDGGGVGRDEEFSITVTPSCPGPKYDHPGTAAVDTLTGAPFLFQWKPRAASTPAYPVTDTTYTLYTEYFNCKIDKPFPSYLVPCDTLVDRVAYYVFRITQESFVEINTQGLWGEVFPGDVRTDSAQLATLIPIQPCMQSYGAIQLCRLQPGLIRW